MPARPASGNSRSTAPATTTTTNRSSPPACPSAPAKTPSTPPAASTSTTQPPGYNPRRTYGRDHLAIAASHLLADKHPLIRSCRSLFAIQLKPLPQLRDDPASRVDVLDRQVLGKAVRPRRLQTAGLFIRPAPLIGQHDE